MKNIISGSLILVCGVLMMGCATNNASPTTQAAAQSQHAECLVCKMNVDLACVDVAVDKTTPTHMYNGQTYYFCSDDCKNEFLKNPQKYLAAK